MIVTSMQSVRHSLGEVEPQREVTDVGNQGVKYPLQSITVCGGGAKCKLLDPKADLLGQTLW